MFKTMIKAIFEIIFIDEYQEKFRSEYEKRDKFLLILVALHWFTATFITSITYETYAQGFLIGGLIFFGVLFAYILFKGEAVFRAVIGISIMLFSALFIQQHFGRIEMHFHIFLGLAVLVIYKDIVALGAAASATAIHHLLFNYLQSNNISVFDLQPYIFNYGCGMDIVLLHATFVILESLILGYIILVMRRDFIKILEFSDALLITNEKLEEKVKKRTKELESAKVEAEGANKIKSEFLANMSHEIRTPLNAILGFTEILEENIKDKEHKNYLEYIKNAGANLLNIINDILDISKIEAGKIELIYHPINIKNLLMELQNIFYFSCEKKGIDLLIEYDENIVYFELDVVRLRQIMINLIGNSVKFTNDGYVLLKIKNSTPENGLTNITINVEDTGIGISQENIESIFDHFKQVESHDNRKFDGTGLGLSITRKLTNLMSGEISVESEYAKGTVFKIEFKNVKVSYTTNRIATKKENYNEIIFYESKVLIVEDVKYIRELIKGYLLHTNLELYEAVDGEDGVIKALEIQPDLILMDIKMPKFDGYTAFSKIREKINIPTVAISASIIDEDIEKIRKTFNGYIRKPVLRSELFESVLNYLPHKRVENESSEVINEHDEENINNAIFKISKELYDEYRYILKNKNITDTEIFCKNLLEFAKSKDNHSIINYANKLLEHLKSFDIEALENDLIKLDEKMKVA